MTNLYATNDWGIYVSDDGAAEVSVTIAQLEEAGFTKIHPIAGEIYFDADGEYMKADMPFWFLPIEQPGLFDAPYENMEAIEAEVEPLLPELFHRFGVAERLVRINVVCGE